MRENELVVFEKRGVGFCNIQVGMALVFCKDMSSSWMKGLIMGSDNLYWRFEIRTCSWRSEIYLMLKNWRLKKKLFGKVFSIENLCLIVVLIICCVFLLRDSDKNEVCKRYSILGRKTLL